ncbi:MAG TPA: pseudouridine synthase [Vicinamibacterales bacterium]|nr:pseudouridine synthase [Vicinamibacterales bacterium]
MERLQKILSQAGIASRRASEQLMLQGRVTVNGAAVRELGSKADPEHDDIRVDGRRVKPAPRHRYILLNKPRGYVTTRSDPQKRPTVIDLLTSARGIDRGEYVYPVGRLDFDSEGLLLLTNDGALAAQLTHPRHEVERVYEVRVLGDPDDHDLQRLQRGIMIDGRRTAPAGVQSKRGVLTITVCEGRNRQIRKMCEAIGHPVTHLKRIAIGPIRDASLKAGRWRDLTEDEVSQLVRAAQKPPRRGHAPQHS